MNNSPTYKIYHIADRGEEKGYWREIGSAWENQDGSLNQRFELIPTNFGKGKIQVRKAEDKPSE